MLIQGSLLFLAIGFLFFLVILAVEYFLWLSSTGRLVLFFVFIGIELFLFYKFMLIPLLYLLRLKSGISNKEASLLIGRHFPDVDDRLYNLLDLAEDKNQSELLLASIEQRSERLRPIPFVAALNFKESFKYAKYLILPALVFGLIWLSGNLSSFFGSYERVVNYDMAYEPPAPFVFKLLSNDLNVLENETFTALVSTEGKMRPENVHIVVNGREMLLQDNDGMFRYEFRPPLSQTDFYFVANDVRSRTYTLNVLEVPSIQDFKMVLDYPNYTGKTSETLKSTGNATFPEGTNVTWSIVSENTKEIQLHISDTSLTFSKSADDFGLSQKVYRDMPYELSTSNANVRHFETLQYRFKVIKDAYPGIKVSQVLDSLNPNISYYSGEASDDYRLKDISLVYYQDDDIENRKVLGLVKSETNFEQFYYTFPSGLELEPGKAYSFYFEATDNDAIHKGKSTKSQIFSTLVLDEDQLRNKELESRQAIIQNLDSSLESFKKQKGTLKDINKEQKEKQQLNFNDQNQVRDFLRKQKQQEALMQKFSRQLKENLDKDTEDDQLKELLKERLERQELEAKRNEKLLEELSKITDKMKKEELTKRLEELGKKQQNSERNLEQLLELTKRYYVAEKVRQLAKDLEKLAKEQDQLSELEIGKDFSEKDQQNLNMGFEKMAEEMDNLDKDNKDLKKPLKLNFNKESEKSVKKDQQEALEEINKHQEGNEPSEAESQQQNAKQKQKSAARKIREMSKALEQSASGAGGSTITEDAEMLRQILDNLVTFSFKQEGLHDTLENSEAEIAQFGGTVRQQQELRNLFEHVDDSLFALSLRRAELSEFVNEQITEVYYNMDKSLESISENQIYQGVSYQKYVLNASNSLADFLAKLLDNMQESMMSGSGSGQGNDFQLPDIIKGQGELKEKMEGMGKSGEGQPQQGEGQGQSGEGKKQGEKGQNQGEGESGSEGESNNSGRESESGKGSDGDGKGEKDGKGSQEGGLGEEELKEIYEIYKEQQLLREQLEKQLEDMINGSDRKLGQKLLKQMEDFENDLLQNGITERTIDKANNLEYELLKLENAALRQGKKEERESNVNREKFQSPILTKPVLLENYRNEIEILNRQTLPLRRNFQDKVREYFKSDD
jgi:hypothetical protein